ncbi:hypothetical protein I9Y19_004053 [Citrobacter freundii]|uniref:Uncharacterized protein n=1 Tax=Citrobacter freundii TaxID=546 RepID=A0ABY7L9J2_CITFR|nr:MULTISPECIES: hypothetical protein [Enterobacteriaceae]EBO0495813.1 hypothetical protein [Salmonella enterica]EBW6339159.1 hypothetical protein [Salmonella enterica subsp. enterica serovar Oslo]EFS1406469.1 hypothetical protein [Salmonella enterica]EHL8522130.1 hypothetical protein [Salmonella enterica]EHT6055135.1 hypothetical protein [Salmonella enterica]
MKNAMIAKLSAGQPRKEKPTAMNQLTLLDIIANGTAIRLFKETLVSFDNGSRTRYVMSVRRPSGRGWMAKQIIWPEGELEQALLEANKVAQQEIQRASLLATA